MRKVTKLGEPDVLKSNFGEWTTAFLADQQNQTSRTRYRHSDIKRTLKDETGYKCVYCESKIGHNIPGDVEHMVPSSVDGQMHFLWSNLTIACTECNRRKNAYFSSEKPFLNPMSMTSTTV
jgi:5-methylcytosine-specific restriction endonuclease McrA